MTPEAKAARARYMREWRRKNPEKQQKIVEKRWQNLAEKYRREKEESEDKE